MEEDEKQRLTDHLLVATDSSLYRSAVEHPFLKAAHKRALDNGLLSLWLSQDRIYAAHAYPRFIGALISKIPFSAHHGIGSTAEKKNQAILSILSYSLQNVVREANFFLEAAKKHQLELECWKERAATKAYCAEMARVSTWLSLEEGLVFLWAMEKLYLDSWRFVASCQSSREENESSTARAINELASNWTNTEFIKFVDDLASIVDNLGIEPGTELWTRAKQIWDRVVELEVEFWPQTGEQVSSPRYNE